MQKHKPHCSTFTLIELLVVISIIGILAARFLLTVAMGFVSGPAVLQLNMKAAKMLT